MKHYRLKKYCINVIKYIAYYSFIFLIVTNLMTDVVSSEERYIRQVIKIKMCPTELLKDDYKDVELPNNLQEVIL